VIKKRKKKEERHHFLSTYVFFLKSNRSEKVRDAGNRMAHDGLNSLKYSVENVIEHRLYTLVKADVKEALG